MAIGILNIKTDWDFSLGINGIIYDGNEETVVINSIDDIKNVKLLGPFGSPEYPFHDDEIKEALEAIINNPKQEFSNLGGNRGASWTPFN